MINAGELNKKITIQKMARAKNSFGEYETTWVNIKSAWAKIKQTDSKTDNKEEYFGDQRVTKVMYEFEIRFMPALKTRFRIVYKHMTFDILSINNVGEKNIKLKIVGEEVA